MARLILFYLNKIKKASLRLAFFIICNSCDRYKYVYLLFDL